MKWLSHIDAKVCENEFTLPSGRVEPQRGEGQSGSLDVSTSLRRKTLSGRSRVRLSRRESEGTRCKSKT